MLVSYQWTSAILGLSIAAMILILIRRDHLQTHHVGWWLLIAGLIAFLGVFPYVLDRIAFYVNINYPPTLLFIIGMGMLLVKILKVDIYQSQQERKMRRLVQRLALLEARLEQQENSNPLSPNQPN